MDGGLLLNVGSCQFIKISGPYMLLDAILVMLNTSMTYCMMKLSQYSPDSDKIQRFFIDSSWFPGCIQHALRFQPVESKARFTSYLNMYKIGCGLQIALLAVEAALFAGLKKFDLPGAFLNRQHALDVLQIVSVVWQILNGFLWFKSVDIFRIKPHLRGVIMKPPPSEEAKDEVLYDSQVQQTNPVLLNVDTLQDTATKLKPFTFELCVDYWDTIDRPTFPPSWYPTPMVILQLHTGAASENRKEIPATIKKGEFGDTQFYYTLEVPSEEIIGKHRLAMRQPISVKEELLSEKDQCLHLFPNILLPWMQGWGSTHSSRFDQRAGPRPSQSRSADAETEKNESITLLAYEMETSVDFVIGDVEADLRKQFAMERSLEGMQSLSQKMANELSGVFSKYHAEEAAEDDQKHILENPYLDDYYTLLRMRVVGMATSCLCIHSGFVKNESAARGFARKVGDSADFLHFIGENCGLPFAGAATAIIRGAANSYAEHEKAKRVAQVAHAFPTTSDADSVAEEVARKATLRLENDLCELDRRDRENLGATGRQSGRFRSMLRSAGSGLSINAMLRAEERATADTLVKRRAEADAKLLLNGIMEGRFPRSEIPSKQVEALIECIAPNIQRTEAYSEASEITWASTATGNDYAVGEFKHDVGPEIERQLQSQSIIESEGDIARRFLQEVQHDIIKVSWFGFTKKYELRLSDDCTALEWRRIGPSPGTYKVHKFLLVPEIFSCTLSRDTRTLILESGTKTESFSFEYSSKAKSFRRNLLEVLKLLGSFSHEGAQTAYPDTTSSTAPQHRADDEARSFQPNPLQIHGFPGGRG